jgi:hypothetical protein
MERADIGVIEGGDDASLALEPFREARARDLDGYLAAKALVARAVDLTHTADPKETDNLVGPEFFALREWHGDRQFIADASKPSRTRIARSPDLDGLALIRPP